MESKGIMQPNGAGVWSVSSLWSCLLLPPCFPRLGSWLVAALPTPWDHCHLLPSAFIGSLGTGVGRVGAGSMCPAHLAVGHRYSRLCSEISVMARLEGRGRLWVGVTGSQEDRFLAPGWGVACRLRVWRDGGT